MGLEDRDYPRGDHYPSCTCVACWKKRSERPAKDWCSKHNEPKGESDCWVCLLETRNDRSPYNGSGRVLDRFAAWRHSRIR